MADVTLKPRVSGALLDESAADSLRRRISGRVDLRLRLVERVAVTLLDRALHDGEAEQAAKESAVLAQWLGVLQLSGAATLCRRLAAVLGEPDLDASIGLQIAGLVDDLRAVVHAASAEISTTTDHAPSLRLVGPESVTLDSLMWLLMRRGLDVDLETSLTHDLEGVDALITVSHPAPPVALGILDLSRERSETIGRVVIHSDESIDVLCDLARSSELLVPETMPANVMADEIQRFVLGSRTEPDEVTVLGSEAIAKTLADFGISCRSTTTAQAAFESLEAGSRTLVLGHRTPTKMATGLVGLVRGIPHLHDVVIATTGFDELTERVLRRGGVDLVVPFQADPDGWVVHLKALRSRRRRNVEISVDKAATILPWPRASVLLDRSLVVSRRLDSHAALAVIDFDESILSDGRSGSDRVTDALATEFRLDDVVGRRDKNRIVVLLRGAGRRAAVARIATALKRLELEDGARVGVAEFPVDGSILTELLDSALRVIDSSRAAGGPTVVSTDWRPDAERAPDIVLVEADRSLAGVLESLFERRGRTTFHLRSGAEALDHFTGPEAPPLPKLLILEMDAPGADGLMVLRALRRHGIMGRLTVLMTCARVRDGELQEAFELGAIDVVVKPYSAVVVSQRVNRLLEH